MLRPLKEILRALLRQPVFAPFFGWLLGRRLSILHESDAADALNVLVFSDLRWRQDLEALARAGGLRLYVIDSALQRRINALFAVPGKAIHEEYFCESDPEILRLREAHGHFVARLVPALRRKVPLDCAVTPTVHYRQEHPWAEGFDRAGLPFVALHKEFTVLDEGQVPERVVRFRARKQTFLGSHACVANPVAKRLFVEAGVFAEEKISVIGLLRMDNLLRDTEGAKAARRQHQPRVVTLFSFGHISGGFSPTTWRSMYFSQNDDEGFVQLFKDVHVGFAELALRHPDVEFKIKPKNVEPWWFKEIEAVVEEALDRPLESIANCRIVADPAPDLMAESCATIGFNSTVLLESLALGVETIMPVFAEAAEVYSQYVYFPDFRDVFTIARSKDDLIALVDKAIAGEPLEKGPPERVSELLQTYLGYDDGHTAERAIQVLRAVVAGQAQPLPFTSSAATVDQGRGERAAAVGLGS